MCGGGNIADQVLVVAGGGASEANGSYTPNGNFNGMPQWINKSNGLEIWRAENGEWRIGNYSNSQYYYVSEPIGDGQDAHKFFVELNKNSRTVPIWRVPMPHREDRHPNAAEPVPNVAPGLCGGWCCGVC